MNIFQHKILEDIHIAIIEDYILGREIPIRYKHILERIPREIIQKWIKLKEVKQSSQISLIVLKNIRDTFQPTYLAITSILQGLLLKAAHSEYNMYLLDDNNQPDFLLWCQLISFIILVATVWNEYRMGVTAYKWTPKLVDTMIPFGLAIVEIFLLKSIFSPNQYNFFFLSSLMWFGAYFAFQHMYYKTKKENIIDNEIVIEHMNSKITFLWSKIPIKQFNKLFCLTSGILHFLLGILIMFSSNRPWLIIVFSIINLVSLLTIIISGDILWSKYINRLKEAHQS